MPQASIVRPATPDDKDEIWRLCRLHHAENALLSLSEKKVEFYIERSLYPDAIPTDDLGPRGIIGVIGRAGALEAAVMLVLGSPWYSDQIQMDDAMNFVDPKHRRSDHAKSLLSYTKHLVDQIRQQGHPEFRMMMGVVSTERTAAKIRLYSRQLSPVGAFFMYPQVDGMKGLKFMHRGAS